MINVATIASQHIAEYDRKKTFGAEALRDIFTKKTPLSMQWSDESLLSFVDDEMSRCYIYTLNISFKYNMIS